MDAQRLDEMSDAALDRDLQALLAADPSPAFVARVRTQIAADAATAHPWLASWSGVLAIAATVAVVIITLAGYRGSRGKRVGERPAALSTRPILVSASPAGVGLLVAGLQSRVLDRLPRRSRQMTVATPLAVPAGEPEVLVDPREAAALRAFFARARSGDVALAAIMEPTATPPADSKDVHDIYIAPIAFEPVIGAAEDKGVPK